MTKPHQEGWGLTGGDNIHVMSSWCGSGRFGFHFREIGVYFREIMCRHLKCAILHVFMELWTIRTLKNSALVNSDPDHWSIRTFFNLSIRTSKRKISLVNSDLFPWSIRTFSIGQFGPLPLVNSDLIHCSIRTFSIGQFGP